MCEYEEFQFVCGHTIHRLLSHCHFARTDPWHQCFGVKVCKNVWRPGVTCQGCLGSAHWVRGQEVYARQMRVQGEWFAGGRSAEEEAFKRGVQARAEALLVEGEVAGGNGKGKGKQVEAQTE